MQFTRKLVTPVIATLLLIGGAAFAQDTYNEVLRSDGTWQDAFGSFQWRYDADTGEFEWGKEGCDSATEVTTSTDALDVEQDTPCRTVALTEPHNPTGDPDGDEASDTEINHGDLVSRVAHDVKDADEAGELEEGQNRGSIISQIARGTKDLFGGNDEESEEPDVVEEPDADESGPPEHANNDKDKKAPPEKAKGKGK
ncbi:MAG: hypothetical protein HKN46_09270 [Acidimicrobiia bacterium]|nr:hypothetical protein [Acidimicrobiia bacterium]